MENKFDDDTFLAKWLNGELSEAELAAFKEREDFELFEKIAQQAGELETPKWNEAQGWEDLNRKAGGIEEERPSTAKVRNLGNWWKYAVAASLLGLIGYFAFFQQNKVQYFATTIGEQKVFELPEGSEAWLNADSKIQFDPNTFAHNRILDLEGEAFFKVKKGSQFTVQTNNGAVRVLGTSFNVFARKDQLEILCYTGKVGLSFDQFTNMETLNPGDQLRCRDRKIIERRKTAVAISQPEWTGGASKFEQVDFVQVIEELERQYGIQINYPSPVSQIRGYSGGFPHGNLETALKVVFSSVDYQYKINGQVIDVYK
ncbi:MAG: FecR domain-containing protein [Bacteroidota bacterium]